MDSELIQLEAELRGLSPSPVSQDVLSRMVKAMDSWQDADVESDQDGPNANASDQNAVESGKVVPFPVAEKRRGSSWKPMWGAAAALAIMGAAAGLLFPQEGGSGVMAMQELGQVPDLRQASLVPASLVPVNVKRKVSSLDAGVVSNRDGVQYQVIRVVRQEEADFKGQDNVGLKITRPKYDYHLVPVTY